MRRIALALPCLLAVACGPSAPASETPHSEAGEKPDEPPPPPQPVCFDQAEEPVLAESLRRHDFPKSRVWVHSKVGVDDLVGRVEDEVPQLLAREKGRNIGAPGRATYRVTRGRPRIRNRGTDLELQVPIAADISVCKPFGSACIQYGKCKPKLDARFRFDTTLDGWKLDRPKGSIRATKKCRIAIDVTPQIEKIARHEVAKVERQLAKRWPNLKKLADQAWKELEAPVAIGPEACGLLRPEWVHYSRPRIESKSVKGKPTGTLVGAVGIGGELRPTSDCKTPHRLIPLKKVEQESKPPETSEIWFPQRLKRDELLDALTPLITGSWGSSPKNIVTLEELRFGEEKIAMRVQAQGEICGPVWITGTLAYDKSKRALRFSPTEHSDTHASDIITEELLGFIADAATLPLEPPSTELEIELMLKGLKALIAKDAKLDVADLKFGKTRLSIARGSLMLYHPASAKLRIVGL